MELQRPPDGRRHRKCNWLSQWNISFKKSWNYASSRVSPITVTPYHVDNNDAEWGPDSCSGLHTVITGTHASTTDTFTCTSTTGKALTGVKPLQHVTLATVGGWGSDYSGTDGGSFWYGKTAKSLRDHSQRQVDHGSRHLLTARGTGSRQSPQSTEARFERASSRSGDVGSAD